MEEKKTLQLPLPWGDGAGLTPEARLQARRNIAEAHMRKMGTRLWRAEEDVVYTLKNDVLPEDSDDKHRLCIRAGRLYQGIPYSFAGCADAAFWDYAGAPDARGVVPVSGLHWKTLSGSGKYTARIGNDCSSSVMQAWSQIGSSFRLTSTRYMVRERGYLPVGDYVSDPSENISNRRTCRENGEAVMFAAYALLRNADALVCRESGAGHVLMAVAVDVVRRPGGGIDGDASFVTVVEQGRHPMLREEKYFHPELGEDVYITFALDVKYSFRELFAEGYLPVTCRELVDPAPAEIPTVWDSLAEPGGSTILEGVISSNWVIDCVTITITGGAGEVVQQGTVYAIRDPRRYAVELRQFGSEAPERMRGRVAPEELPAGSYRCTLTCRLATGQVVTVRDFAFTR